MEDHGNRERRQMVKPHPVRLMLTLDLVEIDMPWCCWFGAPEKNQFPPGKFTYHLKQADKSWWICWRTSGVYSAMGEYISRKVNDFTPKASIALPILYV